MMIRQQQLMQYLPCAVRMLHQQLPQHFPVSCIRIAAAYSAAASTGGQWLPIELHGQLDQPQPLLTIYQQQPAAAAACEGPSSSSSGAQHSQVQVLRCATISAQQRRTLVQPLEQQASCWQSAPQQLQRNSSRRSSTAGSQHSVLLPSSSSWGHSVPASRVPASAAGRHLAAHTSRQCSSSSSRCYSSSINSSTTSSSQAYQLDPIHSITSSMIASDHYHPANAAASQPRNRVVAVAVSGGVDSAVSALLLKRAGYQVFGVYMHNWDPADEAGAGTPTCTSAVDLEDAKLVCAALKMPLYEADFVSKYWNSVFHHFLEGLQQGVTPNPDLACNSHIKFGALLQFAREKGADVLATGHYARLGWAARSAAVQPCNNGGGGGSSGAVGVSAAAAAAARAAGEGMPVLVTGSDPAKDQTYFLASLNQQQLAQAMFPVGQLTKAEVRQIAAAAGLPMATKRSSAGICFIGRRSFGSFLEDYLPPEPGVYVDVGSGKTLGKCSNMLAVTVGQHALGLGGQQSKVYVVGKDMGSGVVHVAAGHNHPALFSSRVLLQQPNWIAGETPVLLQPAGAGAAGGLSCKYKARYRQPSAQCSIGLLDPGQFHSSRFCGGLKQHGTASAAAAAGGGGSLLQQQSWSLPSEVAVGQQQQQQCVAELCEPLRGVTPGQMFVMYDGEVCLGSAMIAAHGPTLFEGG